MFFSPVNSKSGEKRGRKGAVPGRTGLGRAAGFPELLPSVPGEETGPNHEKIPPPSVSEWKVRRGWRGGARRQTSLGERGRKGRVGERQPQQTVQSTFWISWLRKA